MWLNLYATQKITNGVESNNYDTDFLHHFFVDCTFSQVGSCFWKPTTEKESSSVLLDETYEMFLYSISNLQTQA